MDKHTFIRKLLGPSLWINLTLMLALFVGLGIGVWDMADAYTRHGAKCDVPRIKGMNIAAAQKTLKSIGLRVVAVDSLYSRTLPDGLILEQTPAAGTVVKPGRAIEVKVNTHASPTLPTPDIINNCSRREAEQRLAAMGFQLTEPQYAAGARDYVLGLRSEGHLVKAGDRIKTEAPLTLVIGTGTRDGSLDTASVSLPEEAEKGKKKPAPKTSEEEDMEAEAEVIEEIE